MGYYVWKYFLFLYYFPCLARDLISMWCMKKQNKDWLSSLFNGWNYGVVFFNLKHICCFPIILCDILPGYRTFSWAQTMFWTELSWYFCLESLWRTRGFSCLTAHRDSNYKRNTFKTHNFPTLNVLQHSRVIYYYHNPISIHRVSSLGIFDPLTPKRCPGLERAGNDHQQRYHIPCLFLFKIDSRIHFKGRVHIKV